MRELLVKVAAVLEYTGPGERGEYPLGTGCAKVRALKSAVEEVLQSGYFDGRVTEADLEDIPGLGVR
jgi:hypothetical protein